MRDFGQKMLEKWKMAWRDGLFHNICSVENGLYLDVMRANRGFACLPAADSGEDGAVWGRGRVDCLLPGDCRLRVYAFCSDSKALGDWPDMDEGLKSLRGQDRAETWRVLRQIYGEAVSESGEFFIPRAGRYLWIMLELISEGGG
ncbi:MAG: hypothetical protein IJG63_00150, partial [Oscillospiraceae bacterium]|nr:hypothetical protein [Oscillospiraceae bacterium]